jgi:hypothetical protein
MEHFQSASAKRMPSCQYCEKGFMMRSCTRLLGIFLLTASLSLLTNAQSFEFLPEIDIYGKLNSSVRLNFQAKQTKEDGDPTQAEIGPSIDILVKPLARLRRISSTDLDDSKSRALALSFGYRYAPSPDSPTVNRIILAATSNFPLKGGVLIADRNRGELNFSTKPLTWRYRNRLTVERAVSVRFRPTPYGSAEFYYDSKYQKWSSTDLYVGCRFSLGRRTQIDPYYEHENNTGKAPNQQINAFGLILDLYF